MPRLICVFAGRSCHFVGFVTMRLKWTLCEYNGFQRLKMSYINPFGHENILWAILLLPGCIWKSIYHFILFHFLNCQILYNIKCCNIYLSPWMVRMLYASFMFAKISQNCIKSAQILGHSVHTYIHLQFYFNFISA